MRVKFWGTRGSIPVATTSAAIRQKLVAALTQAAGRQLDTPARIEAFVDGELDWAVRHTFGGNSSCVQLDAGEVEHQMILPLGAALQVRGQLRTDIVGRRLVQAALERQHHDVGETGVGDDHRIPWGRHRNTMGSVRRSAAARKPARATRPPPSMC